MRVVLGAMGLFVMLTLVALSACSLAPASTKKAPHPGMPQATPGAIGTPTAPAAALALPERLVIAAIGVNASIEAVGVKVNGDLATPTHDQWGDVGWYEAGPP